MEELKAEKALAQAQAGGKVPDPTGPTGSKPSKVRLSRIAGTGSEAGAVACQKGPERVAIGLSCGRPWG